MVNNWFDGTRCEFEPLPGWHSVTGVERTTFRSETAEGELSFGIRKAVVGARYEDSYQSCRLMALNDSLALPFWPGRIFIQLFAFSVMLIHIIKPLKESMTRLALWRQKVRIVELRAGTLHGHVLLTPSGDGVRCRGYLRYNEWCVYVETRGNTPDEALASAMLLERMKFIGRSNDPRVAVAPAA